MHVSACCPEPETIQSSSLPSFTPLPFHNVASEMDWCPPPPYVRHSDQEPEKDSPAAHQDLRVSSRLAKIRRLESSVHVHRIQQVPSTVAEKENKEPRTILWPGQTKVYRRNKGFYVPSLDKWSQIPWSFEELVALSMENGVLPDFWRIPHVMSFQEFQGYNWEFNANVSHFGNNQDLGSMNRSDQSQFSRIVGATIRTRRRPFVSPDYFFFRDQDRKSELLRMFECRGDIPNVKWDLFTHTKKIEHHPDWPMFLQFVKTRVPTGKFLFKRERGDWKWLCRMIVEDGYLKVDQEIIEFVQLFGGKLRFPKLGLFRRTKWSADDLLEIKYVANQCWIRWRQEAEQELAETE
jgi:hypothetical protein